MTVKEALFYGSKQLKQAAIKTPDLDTEVLLIEVIKDAHSVPEKNNQQKNQVTNRSDRSYWLPDFQTKYHVNKTWLYSHLDQNIPQPGYETFKEFIQRRIQGEPVAYITNKKDFYGLDFYVDQRVMIPRPATETLVAEAINEWRKIHAIAKKFSHLPRRQASAALIDVGTGSGAVIISLFKNLHFQREITNLRYLATDSSPDALEVAKLNAQKHQIRRSIKFYQGSLLSPILKNLARERYNTILITANLPYLTNKEIINEPSIQYEPRQALWSADNGLGHIKNLISQAAKLVCPNLTLLLEHQPEQAKAIHNFARQFFKKTIQTKDLAGLDRVSILLRS